MREGELKMDNPSALLVSRSYSGATARMRTNRGGGEEKRGALGPCLPVRG